MKFDFLNERVLKYRGDFSAQKTTRLIIKVSLSMIIVMKFLLSCADLVVWNTYWSPGLIVGENWCTCAICVVTVKYILLVQYYMHKYRELDYQITVLNDLTRPKNGAVMLKDVRRLQSLSSSSKSCASNQTSEPAVWSTVASDSTLCLSHVRALKEHHMDLFEEAQLINSTYGFQILLSFALIFVENILGYSFVIDLMLKILSQKEGIATDVQKSSSLFMALISSLTLISLTVSCHLAGEEANRSQLLTHRLFLRSDLGSDMILQLQLFSSKVSSLGVTFTACGFFTINTSLLYATAGVICTYLIILYQFR
jgi:hypothetical protein